MPTLGFEKTPPPPCIFMKNKILILIFAHCPP